MYIFVFRICPSEQIKKYEIQGGSLANNLPLTLIEADTYVGLGGRNLSQSISVKFFFSSYILKIMQSDI